MVDIRFGLVEGEGKGREVALSPNMYLHRMGGHFVHMHLGVATLCASGETEVSGWLEAPKQADGYEAWKSSSTRAADKAFMVYSTSENVFEMPANEAEASLGASWLFRGAGIVTSGSTYTLKQKAKFGAAASQLTVVDYDKDNKTVFVRVKNSKVQAV
jgi:hypothetical protein